MWPASRRSWPTPCRTSQNINIEYMYAILSSSEHAYMIFRVADTVRAEAAMRGRGFKGISQDEMSLI